MIQNALLVELAQAKNDFLRAPHGKRRDQDIAAAFGGLTNDVAKLIQGFLHRAMIAIPIGGLHQ